MNDVEEPLTAAEMAVYLKQSAYTVREKAKRGEIPGHKISDGPRAQWRFYLSEFRAARTAVAVDPWVNSKKRRGRNAA